MVFEIYFSLQIFNLLKPVDFYTLLMLISSSKRLKKVSPVTNNANLYSTQCQLVWFTISSAFFCEIVECTMYGNIYELYQERRNDNDIFENVAMGNEHILVFHKRKLPMVTFFWTREIFRIRKDFFNFRAQIWSPFLCLGAPTNEKCKNERNQWEICYFWQKMFQLASR